MNRINKKKSEIEFQNFRKIIDTRNRIIHGYDTVSEFKPPVHAKTHFTAGS